MGNRHKFYTEWQADHFYAQCRNSGIDAAEPYQNIQGAWIVVVKS